MNIIGTLGGLQLRDFTIPFIETVIENTSDITTLDSTIYTDFVNQKQQWELNWAILTKEEYDNLRAVYDSQFSTGEYPIFSVPYCLIDTPVRMYISAKDIRDDGCSVQAVKVTLIEKSSTSNLVS